MIFLVINQLNIHSIFANAAITTKQGSVVDNARRDLQVRREALTKAREEYNREKAEFEKEKALMEKFLDEAKAISINVGGEQMFTTHGSARRIADTRLGKILLRTTSEKISEDKKSNIFLDVNPSLFRHLLEQLRLFEDGEPIVFYPPLSPALAVQFNAMLTKFELRPAPESDDDVFTFNVGDEIIATKRKTLKLVPDSKLSTLLTMNKPSDMDANGVPFLDYDPKLFRHLLTQLQGGQTRNFEAPSEESRTAYNAMLKNFGLNSN